MLWCPGSGGVLLGGGGFLGALLSGRVLLAVLPLLLARALPECKTRACGPLRWQNEKEEE
jgi:hypothetical protein